jgi:hypothetical protein
MFLSGVSRCWERTFDMLSGLPRFSEKTFGTQRRPVDGGFVKDVKEARICSSDGLTNEDLKG